MYEDECSTGTDSTVKGNLSVCELLFTGVAYWSTVYLYIFGVNRCARLHKEKPPASQSRFKSSKVSRDYFEPEEHTRSNRNFIINRDAQQYYSTWFTVPSGVHAPYGQTA